MGGNNGTASYWCGRDFSMACAQLAGAVDATDTAFALLAYKMLQEKGLKKGDYQVKALGAPLARMQAMESDPNMAVAILNRRKPRSHKRPGSKIRPGCFGGRSLPVGCRLGVPILGTGQWRNADPLYPGQHRRHAPGPQPGNWRALTPWSTAQAAATYAIEVSFDQTALRLMPVRHERLREPQAARRMLGTWAAPPPPTSHISICPLSAALAGL